LAVLHKHLLLLLQHCVLIRSDVHLRRDTQSLFRVLRACRCR
jgi:hypothetical protein